MNFFRHDCNSHESKFFQGLIKNFGFEGYGRFWVLLEICYEQLNKHDKSFMERCEKTGVEFQFFPDLVCRKLKGKSKKLPDLFNFCQETSDFSWTPTEWLPTTNRVPTESVPSTYRVGTQSPLGTDSVAAGGHSVPTEYPWSFRVPNILKRLTTKEFQYWSRYSWDGHIREEKIREDKIRDKNITKKILATPPERPPGAKPPPPDKFHLLTNIWNLHCGTLGKVKLENPSRRKHIALRWKEAPDDREKYWTQIVKRMAASDFCTGKTTRGWRASFDFLLKPDTHLRVDEGQFDNRGSESNPPARPTFSQQKTKNNADLYAKYEGVES